MDAEIIAIGTELLLGVTVDTNSAYLSQQLATIGVPVRRVTLVRDDMREIVGAIRESMSRVELVVCSGGLGPTGDDLTREAIAQATDRPLEFHQTLLDDIAERFARLKRPMSDSNRQQAFAPQGAYLIRNPRGTAPSFVAERDGRYVAALPGVPQELTYLTEHALLPYLRDQHGLNEVLVVSEVRVSGMTEAAAGELIDDIMLGDNPIVGITAKRGQHTIRIAAKGPGREAAEALIAPLLALIRERFQGYLMDDEPLEVRVGRLLCERGLRVDLWEDSTIAPVFRALTQTDAGQRSVLRAVIGQTPESADDYAAAARSLVIPAAESIVRLAVLTEPGDGAYRTIHVALTFPGDTEPRSMSRGVDFGLAQAHDFVAAAALDLLRHRLEAASSTSAPS